MIKALLFDFDGVLVSSYTPRFNALQTFAAKHGVIIDEKVRQIGRGKATHKLLLELMPDSPDVIESILNEFKVYRENITEYVQPIELLWNLFATTKEHSLSQLLR